MQNAHNSRIFLISFKYNFFSEFIWNFNWPAHLLLDYQRRKIARLRLIYVSFKNNLSNLCAKPASWYTSIAKEQANK